LSVDKVILLAVILSGAKNLDEILRCFLRMTDYEQSSVAVGFKPTLHRQTGILNRKIEGVYV